MLALETRLLMNRRADLREQLAQIEQQILSVRGHRCSSCGREKDADDPYGTCPKCRQKFRDIYARQQRNAMKKLRRGNAKRR